MPPIKGRMMGRMGVPASVQQSTKLIRHVQKTTIARRKFKGSPIKSSSLPDNIKEDTRLMSMRMPEDIVRILPSVKKYKGSKDFVDLTDDISSNSGDASTSVKSETEAIESPTEIGTGTILGLAHRGRGINKYAMKQTAEERFMGIIFDVGFSPSGDIFIACCEGLFMCDSSLDRKMKLEQVVMPGGVNFFQDGQIVAICRNQDTINFFSKDGVFIKAFKGGFSPMCLVINERDELIVSDPGKKCLHVFNTDGEEICNIPSAAPGYSLRWPMYMATMNKHTHEKGEELIVCDCHAQTVVKFNSAHKYSYTYKLKTSCSNEVLRPHGIATNQDQDLFVIDTTMETVEVFSSSDTFIQTLITADEGVKMKPKCLALDNKGLLLIGGRLGVVRVYSFLDCSEYKRESSSERTPIKSDNDSKKPQSSETPIKIELEDKWSTGKKSSSKKSQRSLSETPSKRGSLRAVKRNVFSSETPVKEEIKEEESNGNEAKNSDVIILE